MPLAMLTNLSLSLSQYPLTTTLQPPMLSSSFRPITITFSNTSILDHSTLRSHDPAIASAFASPTTPAGSAVYSLPLNAIVVKTLEGILAVHMLKVASKKAKTAQEWYRAYRDRADPASGLLRFQ